MNKLPNILIFLMFLVLIFINFATIPYTADEYSIIHSIRENEALQDTGFLKLFYLKSIYSITGFVPFYMRLGAFFLYTLNCLLLFLCVKRIIRNDLLAYISAGLMAAFPVHIFNLVSISGSYEILKGILLLMILFLHSKSMRNNNALFAAGGMFALCIILDPFFVIIVYFILVLQLLSGGFKKKKRLIRFFVFPYLLPALGVITIKTIFLDTRRVISLSWSGFTLP